MNLTLAASPETHASNCENDSSLLGLIAPIAAPSDETEAGFASLLNQELADEPAWEPAVNERTFAQVASPFHLPDLRREASVRLVPVTLLTDEAVASSASDNTLTDGISAEDKEAEPSRTTATSPPQANSLAAAVLAALQAANLPQPVIELLNYSAPAGIEEGEADIVSNPEANSDHTLVSPQSAVAGDQSRRSNSPPQPTGSPTRLNPVTQGNIPAETTLQTNQARANATSLESAYLKPVEAPQVMASRGRANLEKLVEAPLKLTGHETTGSNPGDARQAAEAAGVPFQSNWTGSAVRMMANTRKLVTTETPADLETQAAKSPEPMRTGQPPPLTTISLTRATSDLDSGGDSGETQAATKPGVPSRLSQPEGSVRMVANSRIFFAAGSASANGDAPGLVTDQIPESVLIESELGRVAAAQPLTQPAPPVANNQSRKPAAAEAPVTTGLVRDIAAADSSVSDTILTPAAIASASGNDQPTLVAAPQPQRKPQLATDAVEPIRGQTAREPSRIKVVDEAGITKVNPVRIITTSEAAKAELSGREFSATVVTTARARTQFSAEASTMPEQSQSVRWVETEARPTSTWAALADGNPGKSWLANLRPEAATQVSISELAGQESNTAAAADSAPAEAKAGTTAPPPQSSNSVAMTREKGASVMTEKSSSDQTPATDAAQTTPTPTEWAAAQAKLLPLSELPRSRGTTSSAARATTPQTESQVQPDEPVMLDGSAAKSGLLLATATRTEARPASDTRESARVQEPDPANGRTPKAEVPQVLRSPAQLLQHSFSTPADSLISLPSNNGEAVPIGLNDSHDQASWRSLRLTAATPAAQGAPELKATSQGSSTHGQLNSHADKSAPVGVASQLWPENLGNLPQSSSSTVESTGIVAAQNSEHMNKREKTIRPATSTEQNLPDKVNPAGALVPSGVGSVQAGAEVMEVKRAVHSLPDDRMVTGMHSDSVARPLSVEDSILPRAELQARRTMTVETTELIADHALQLRQLDSDRLSVVVQPDSRTRLRLELHFDGSVVEAHASLESGDFGLLSACWSELQARLWEQGVRIAPLTAVPVSATAWAGGELPSRRENFANRNHSLEDAGQPTTNLADPKKGHAARVSRGTNRFDLWA